MGKKRKRKVSSQEQSPSGQEPEAQKKTVGRKKKNKQPALKQRENPDWLLTGLAAAGMMLTAYLTLTVWLGQPPLYCDEGSSCDIVQQSRWGTFMGLPTAFLGFLIYTSLAFVGVRVRNPGTLWKSAWTVSLVGLAYSVYLITVSLFVIEAACVYCLVSFSIMTVIFGVLTYKRPEGLPDFSFAVWAKQAVIVAAIIVGGMHLYYSGIFDPAVGPEDPYLQGLAEHLSKEKAVLYGAFW